MTKAILFDLDGTLCDTAVDIISTVKRVCIENGLTVTTTDLRPQAAYSSRHIMAAALNIDLDDPLLDKLMPFFYTYYAHTAGDNAQFFDGIEPLLTELHKRNIIFGIVTNKMRAPTITVVEKFKNRFPMPPSVIVCADDVELPKPAPNSLLMACKKLNLSPEQAVYLGDAPSDIIAGHSAGIKTYACRWGYIPNFPPIENWGASHILPTPLDLLDTL